MSKQQKIITSIVGITIVLLALLGITYAYYLTRIEGNTNTNSISITTADLTLKYGDGNGIVTKENIMPGTTIEKTFTVTNDGNSKVDNYAVYLEEVINTLTRTEDLTYVLECSSSNGECFGSKGEFPTLAGLIVTNSIDVGVTHTYKLTVTYANLDTVDQSDDMGSEISAFVQIYAMKDIVDITGEVTGASEGDYIQINSVQKRSQIVGGKYTLGGVKPGSHTIKVCGKSDTTCSSPKFTKTITINLGTTASVSGDVITITENSQTATIDINVTNTSVTIGTTVKDYNPFKDGTLAYNIFANAYMAKTQNSKERTHYSPIPLSVPGTKIEGQNEIFYVETVSDILTNSFTIDYFPIVIGTSYELNKDTGNFTLVGTETCYIPDCDFQDKYIYNYNNDYISDSYVDSYSIIHITNVNYVEYYDGLGYIGDFDYEKISSIKTSEADCDEKTLSVTADEKGISYYFRGGVEDNYVNFNNMCWRIMRIDGNDNVKLILQDFSEGCNSNNVNLYNAFFYVSELTSSSIFDNYKILQPEHFNYFYNYMDNILLSGGNISHSVYNSDGNYSDTDYNIAAISESDKSKLVLNKNYVNFEDKYDKNTFNIITDSSDYVDWYYDPYVRLIKDNNITLKESGITLNDSYVTLISADEALYAGLSLNSSSFSYLNHNVKTTVDLQSDAIGFWTDSITYSGNDSGSVAQTFVLHDSGQLMESYTALFWSNNNMYRPVITIDNSKASVTGDGTIDNPYVIN